MKFKYLILVCILFSSCEFFNFKKKGNQQLIDTIVDFSKIDSSPFFLECKDKIDEDRLTCFRTTIHHKLSKNLAAHKIIIKDSIDEVLEVFLSIDSKGSIKLKDVYLSDNIKHQIPNIDSLLKVSVEKLPKIYPALKRSIPVTTQYRLPIRIQYKK